ncbi:MAG: ParA family protein [Actinomycetia bacterium]|nr:ParA family protein [Actinomycetes bacterium]MCP3912717.1 ParA family protein [Actinomycetes bacterium]MCP4085566.1 ParA family protein [Actinomycetes bacterium]
MTSRVAILNQKGGVGKTTVTLGLASAAAFAGVPTLVVDIDPQASATWALGVDPGSGIYTAGDALTANRSGAAGDMITEGGWGPSVWLLPGGGDLTERETDGGRANASGRLKKALEGVTDDFELVLIDCAPSLGLNTLNGLVAADLALVVVEPSAFSLRGVTSVTDTIDNVFHDLNPDLDIAGVVLNKVPAVSAEADRRIDELGRMVGRKTVWKPSIPQRVIVNQAHGERRPVHDYGWRASEVSQVFDQLLARLRRSARA